WTSAWPSPGAPGARRSRSSTAGTPKACWPSPARSGASAQSSHPKWVVRPGGVPHCYTPGEIDEPSPARTGARTPMEREKSDERIRLLIADDTTLLRLGIRGALERDGADFDIVGEAENGHQALEMTHALSPDVILMDSTLVGVNGIEVTRLIKQQTPTVAVIIITAFEDEEELFNSIKVGASAYLTMDVQPADLIASVRRAHAGSYLINDSVLA